MLQVQRYIDSDVCCSEDILSKDDCRRISFKHIIISMQCIPFHDDNIMQNSLSNEKRLRWAFDGFYSPTNPIRVNRLVLGNYRR